MYVYIHTCTLHERRRHFYSCEHVKRQRVEFETFATTADSEVRCKDAVSIQTFP
jgi:hypothetical protein